MKSKAPSRPAMPAADRQYRAQDALHTITRAEQHKKDPALMRDVRKLATEHAKAVTPVKNWPKGKC